MSKLPLLVLFFTKHSEEAARALCTQIGRSRCLNVKLVACDSTLDSEHIRAKISVPYTQVPEVAKRLKRIACRITAITNVDDVFVSIMGHPDVFYHTKAPAASQA